MELIDIVLAALPKEPIPVRKVLVGVHWTLVCSKYCGLGSTLVSEGPHGHQRVRDVGHLHEKSAQELAGWIHSDNLLEASIGIAAINSMISVNEDDFDQVNAADIIAREGVGKNVVIIGHFPFAERIKTIAKNCWVIEKRPYGDDFPENDFVAITGTAFINHTMDHLLALRRPESNVMILGPSTPLLPLLFDHGITYLSGSIVVDEEEAINTVIQGAIFPQVNGVRLITLSKGR
jgi:uncharacterized protein (DUF4213/DUF364 family)